MGYFSVYKKLVIFTCITAFCVSVVPNFAQSISIGTWSGNGTISLTLNWPSTNNNLPAANAPMGANVQYAIQPGDLIHWIFPDGNFKNVIYTGPGSLTTYFRPSPGYACLTNRVSVTLVRKGGGVPPPMRVSNPVIGTIPCPPPSVFALSVGPSRLYFEATANLQLNNAWDWTPTNENYLIVSYRNADQFSQNLVLYYDPNVLEFIPALFVASQSEIITNPVPGQLHISKLNQKGDYQIYLRARVLNVGAGERFMISLSDQASYTGTVYAFAHDPNQKNVDQSHLCPWQNTEQSLQYHVRFLNTGAWYANDVVVTDELCTLVDPNTATVQGSFANMTTTITENTLKVSFPELLLPGLEQTYPDRYSYDQASHEFSLRVDTKSCLEPGSIKNQCLVFFDQLAPVATNVALTMIMEQDDCIPSCVPLGSEANDRNSETSLLEDEIAPNPTAAGSTMLTFYTATSGDAQVQILDGNGRSVYTILPLQLLEKGVHQLDVNTSNLPSGIYFIQLKSLETPRIWKLIVI